MENLRTELNEQNEAMVNRTKQIHRVAMNLDHTKHQKSQIEVEYADQIDRAKRIQTQIAEYEQNLQENQTELNQLEEQRDNQLQAQRVIINFSFLF